MFENMFIADVLFVITLRLQTVASHEPGMEGGSGVQRRVRDQAARQRRGSIKSRIVQFSKVSTVQYSTAQYSTVPWLLYSFYFGGLLRFWAETELSEHVS